MPNGQPGDHPLTDIVVPGLVVYSAKADGLVREIVALGGRDEIEAMLFERYNVHARPDVAELERTLTAIRDRRRREAKERGVEG